MAIKQPPATLDDPNYHTLEAGGTIHRIHQTAYPGDAFNPCAGGQTRFAPVHDTAANCVPSLYAGSSLDSAIYESIFHDIPATAPLKTVPKREIEIRSHTELEVVRDLELAKLFNADLQNWGISRQNLIGTSAKLYNQTAKWAEAIHHQFPAVEGLVWTSNRFDPDFAYVFFGDRVTSADFRIAQSRDGQLDPSFLSDVRQAGKIAGITITV